MIERRQDPVPEPVPEPDKKKPTRRSKNAVLVYVAVMFAAAFLLVLFSFLLQQRTNSKTVNALTQSSNTAVDRAQELEDDVTGLREENQALSLEKQDLARQLENLQGAYDTLAQQASQAASGSESLQTDYNALQSRYTALETELAQAAAQLEALTQTQAGVQAQYDAVSQLLSAANCALVNDWTGLESWLAAIDAAQLPDWALGIRDTLAQRLSYATSEHAD